MAAGLGAVLCLDRGDRRGDIAASALVLVALASSSLGISFALGVLVEALWDRGRRRRLWTAAVPLALYGAWYLAYRGDRVRQGPVEYGDAPWYAVRSAVAAIGGYLGVGNPSFGVLRDEAVRGCLGVLVIGLLAVATWLVLRRSRLTPRVAMVTVTLASFWAFLSVSRAYLGDPYISRYIYPGAFLVVLLAVEIAPPAVPPVRAQAALALGAAAATVLGVAWLHDGSWWLRGNVHAMRAELGAIEIARGRVPGDFNIDTSRTAGMRAAGYFATVDRLGSSPAETPTELRTDIEPARVLADALLLRAYALHPVPYSGATRRLIDAARGLPNSVEVDGATRDTVSDLQSCSALHPRSHAGHVDVILPRVGVVVRPSTGDLVRIQLRRFAADFAPAGPVWTADAPVWINAPKDRSTVPWHARFAADRPLLVC
jgi:hypothetical protein